MKNFILGLMLIALGLSLSFLCTAGILYVIFWIFNIEFSMKIALGIWLIMLLLQGIFKNNSDK